MARPRLKNPRDQQLNIGLTASELADVQRCARLAGMRPVDYGRARILGKPDRPMRMSHTLQALDPVLLVHLSRLGNNLNQIARRLNELSLPSPEELASLLSEIRAALRRALTP